MSFSHHFFVCLDCQIRGLSQEPNSHSSSEGRDSLLFVGQVVALRELDQSPPALLNNTRLTVVLFEDISAP